MATRWRAVGTTKPALAETSSFASDVLPEREGHACESIGVPGSRQETVVNGTNSLHSCGETELGFDCLARFDRQLAAQVGVGQQSSQCHCNCFMRCRRDEQAANVIRDDARDSGNAGGHGRNLMRHRFK